MCRYAGLAVVVRDAPASWQIPHRVLLAHRLARFLKATDKCTDAGSAIVVSYAPASWQVQHHVLLIR